MLSKSGNQYNNCSKKTSDQLDDKGQQEAENNHRSDRKIESEIFFLHPDITGQTANPVQFIMKEIYDYTCDNDENTNDNDPFSCIAVHNAKIRWINEAVKRESFPGKDKAKKSTRLRVLFHLIHTCVLAYVF